MTTTAYDPNHYLSFPMGKDAKKVRDSAIYRFKREFFLSLSTTDIPIAEANKRAEEIVEILFPPVTDTNAADYLNRAW